MKELFSNERLNYYRTGEFDLRTPPEDEEATNCSGRGQVKAIVCFEIAPDYRGKGIASMLLERVCEDAKAEGFKYVEAYPVKDGGYMGMAFTGPMHMYEKAGFVYRGKQHWYAENTGWTDFLLYEKLL